MIDTKCIGKIKFDEHQLQRDISRLSTLPYEENYNDYALAVAGSLIG